MHRLNHVCKWTEHGWKRITAEQAAEEHPGGTVSYYSSLFMCELCRQYVTFTDGEKVPRYFRHSDNDDKNCPERTFGSNQNSKTNIDPRKHNLPLRLIVKNNNSFSFELGFLYVPRDFLDKQACQEIIITTSDNREFKYNFERLNDEHITYLGVGNMPSEYYDIKTSEILANFWPDHVEGVNFEKHNVFDARTGIKLPADSDVQTERKYYVLTCRYLFRPSADVTIRKIIDGKNWKIYEVKAEKLSKEAGRFFLELGCWLTDRPLKINMIWPVHIETPYVNKHDSNNVILYFAGNRSVSVKTYPPINPVGRKVVQFFPKGRQQLIVSAGTANILQYIYLWRERLDTQKTDSPEIEVKDINGTHIEAGEHTELPKATPITIIAPFDGTVITYMDNAIIDKQELFSDKMFIVSHDVKYGIKLGNKNIGFNEKFYTFPYFLTFLLKRFLNK